MSIEENIGKLVQSNNAMAQAMEGQAGVIDKALLQQEQKVNQFIKEAPQHSLLPLPLNTNAFLIGGATGYGATGNAEISAVHPFTKGFEGPYFNEQPSIVATREANATEAEPYWFGRYNKGPRATFGGLAGGWHGIGDGHILKLTKPEGGQHRFINSCVFSLNNHIKLNKFIFRAYVWIESGPLYFGIGPADSGGHVEVPSVGEWHPVNKLISFQEITAKTDWRMRLESDEAQEIYIAMPNIFAVQGIDNDFTLMNVEAS